MDGNLLNERKEETLNQFREFFTQKVVKSLTAVPQDGLMDKNVPLYDKRQPLRAQDGHENFWMNTPLKSRKY